MRRIVLATTALAVLALAVPAMAADARRSGRGRRQRHPASQERHRGGLPEPARAVSADAAGADLRPAARPGDRQPAAAGRGRQGEKLADNPEVKAQLAQARDNVLRDGCVKQAIEKGTTQEKLQAAYEAMKSQPDFAFEETHAPRISWSRTRRGQGDHQAARGRGRFREARQARSRPIPRPRPMAAISASSASEAMVPEFAEAAFAIEPGTDRRQAGQVAVRLARDQGR